LHNNKDTNKNFIPGFSINLYKNGSTNENSTIPYEQKFINEKIKKALSDSNKILKFLFNADITKFDYLLSWCKYYDELKEENDIYQYAFEIVNKFINEHFTSKEILDASIINSSKIQNTLYFFNIFFEFFTFYNLKYKENFFNISEEVINSQIKKDLKYILFNTKKGKYEQNPINELERAEQKIDNILFIKSALSILKPIWSGDEKKLLKNENDVYTKYISDSVNRSSFNNELEILFYNYDEKLFSENKDDICNKGMEIIIILYHFFTFFLNIGGTIQELNEYFNDFRLYLLLLITSPSTINLADKKKTWPNEEQNEKVQKTIKIILFNSIYFLYNKIKEYNSQEKEYN
jgi:hypothetical protein